MHSLNLFRNYYIIILRNNKIELRVLCRVYDVAVNGNNSVNGDNYVRHVSKLMCVYYM